MRWTYKLGYENGKVQLLATEAILSMPYPEQVAALDIEAQSRLMWITLGDEELNTIWNRPADMDDRIAAHFEWSAQQARLERLKTLLPGLQARCAIWRSSKPEPVDGERGWIPPTPTNISAKLLEEAGEFSKAVIGQLENRLDRGDPLQEAAQTILVLLSWAGIHQPDRCLLTEVLDEAERAGA